MSWKNMSAAALLEHFAEKDVKVTIAELGTHLSVRDIIHKKYGDPGTAYQSKFCDIWSVKKEFPWFPAEKILINKELRVKLTKAFSDLYRRALYTEIKSFDGCYNNRQSRGINATSLHAWAMAIDLNAPQNPLHGPVRWSNGFLQNMRDAGLYCGADWHRLDGMHFALYNG